MRPELAADHLAFGATVVDRGIAAAVHGDADEELSGELLSQGSRRRAGVRRG